MALVRSTDTHLIVALTGVRRVFGRWRPLAIPLRHLVDVRIDPAAARALPGARWGVATSIPGVVNLGSFRGPGGRAFWDVVDPDRAVVIELAGAKYDRLILEVPDPDAVLAELTARLDLLRRR